MFQRRRIILGTAGVVFILAIGLSVAVTKRKRSEFDYLYALGPTVAEYKPITTVWRGSSVMIVYGTPASGGVTTSAAGPRPQTILVFRKADEQKVYKLLE